MNTLKNARTTLLSGYLEGEWLQILERGGLNMYLRWNRSSTMKFALRHSVIGRRCAKDT